MTFGEVLETDEVGAGVGAVLSESMMASAEAASAAIRRAADGEGREELAALEVFDCGTATAGGAAGGGGGLAGGTRGKTRASSRRESLIVGRRPRPRRPTPSSRSMTVIRELVLRGRCQAG